MMRSHCVALTTTVNAPRHSTKGNLRMRNAEKIKTIWDDHPPRKHTPEHHTERADTRLEKQARQAKLLAETNEAVAKLWETAHTEQQTRRAKLLVETNAAVTKLKAAAHLKQQTMRAKLLVETNEAVVKLKAAAQLDQQNTRAKLLAETNEAVAKLWAAYRVTTK